MFHSIQHCALQKYMNSGQLHLFRPYDVIGHRARASFSTAVRDRPDRSPPSSTFVGAACCRTRPPLVHCCAHCNISSSPALCQPSAAHRGVSPFHRQEYIILLSRSRCVIYFNPCTRVPPAPGFDATDGPRSHFGPRARAWPRLRSGHRRWCRSWLGSYR